MIRSNVPTKKVVIYGIGSNCRQFIRYAQHVDFQVVAYVDKKKKGTIFEGQVVKSPNEIARLEYDEIYVTLADNREVFSELKSMGVEIHKIKDVAYISYKYMMNINTTAEVILLTDGSQLYNYPYLELNNLDNVEVWRPLIQKTEWVWSVDKKNQELTFLVHSHCFGYNRKSGFMKWLKEVYPNSKYIFILSDMIDGDFGYSNRLDETQFDIEVCREDFDLITTYHPIEAKKYNFEYLLLPHSRININEEKIIYDVFFAGLAKNRLDKLYKIYDYLVGYGIKCNFWITGVDEKLIDYSKEGIKYNQYLEYDQYLREVNKSKCILELCKEGNVTDWRYIVAILYGKKLLVNDSTCMEYPCYDERYINIITSEKDISIEWLKEEVQPQYKYNNEFSPVLFLEKIRLLLQQKNDIGKNK